MVARARNIKPGFFTNDQLAECEPLARILFIGLWTLADREGRLEDRPKRIKAEVLPYDDCDIDTLLEQLAKHGFIVRYEVDEAKFIEIPSFGKHQNPHPKEKCSEIPASRNEPCNYTASREKVEPSREITQTDHASSLNPDSGILNLETGNRNPEAGAGAGVFVDVTPKTLRETPRLYKWFLWQVDQPSPVFAEPTDENFRKALCAAEHALRVGKNPVAVFAHNVGKKIFEHGSNGADDRAEERYREFIRVRDGTQSKPAASIVASLVENLGTVAPKDSLNA